MRRYSIPLFAWVGLALETLVIGVGSSQQILQLFSAKTPQSSDFSADSVNLLSTLATVATPPTTIVAMLLHVVGLGGMALLYRRSTSLQARAPDAQLVGLLVATLGIAGALVGLLAALINQWLPSQAMDDKPTEFEPESWESTDLLAGSAALEAASLCDIFRHGSLSQRRSAVALIAANFKPELAEALRMALRDEHNAIRVQAGMVMQQLEDDFVRRQNALEALTQDDLARHGFVPDDVWLRLATLHDHHAFTGLLDDRRTLEAHAKALRAYQQHLKVFPNDLEAIAAVGRLLVRAGQHELVADWLKKQVREGRVSRSIVMWYVEALYRSGRYEAVGDVLTTFTALLAGGLSENAQFLTVMDLWRQQNEPAAAQKDALRA